MPLVTLSIEAGRTRDQKRQLADAVYEALRAGIQIPGNDRFEETVADMVDRFVAQAQSAALDFAAGSLARRFLVHRAGACCAKFVPLIPALGNCLQVTRIGGVARSEHTVFVEITLRRGRPAEKKQALYGVFTNTMSGQQPRGAAFLDGKAAPDFDPAATPFVKTLYREIAQRMTATGLVRAEDLLIVLHENDLADWSFGNGVAQYVEREHGEREQMDASRKQVRQ